MGGQSLMERISGCKVIRRVSDKVDIYITNYETLPPTVFYIYI